MTAEACLARASWQPLLFAELPRRADLLALTPSWPLRRLRLNVLRNQPFEFVASVLKPFLAFAGWEAEISLSHYDDSLGFQPDAGADVVLLWLDFDRYELSSGQLLELLADRLAVVRRSTDARLLVSDWASCSEAAKTVNAGLRTTAREMPGVYIADQAAIAGRLGSSYHDTRTAHIAGMTISDRACLETARQLGLVWLPALLEPGIKAMVVDFDGTLYDGVLGEDGPAGITVGAAHLELQERLIELRAGGIYLAGISRNDPADLDRLFIERRDLKLRREDFSALVAGWEPKAESLRRIAAELRIGADTMLFLDDNPGELASAASEFAGIRCLHVADAALTVRALKVFPGLLHFRATEADQLRIRDLAAAAPREQAGPRSGDQKKYLRSLQVELTFAVDARVDQQRLHELSNKTNQFNTRLLRLSPVEVARYVDDPLRHAVSISLRDRLSDSGIIGAVFTRQEGTRVVVDEVAISCRALGRRLERLMVVEALRRAIGDSRVTEVALAYRSGPRNRPAREWLEEFAGPFKDDAGRVNVRWDGAHARQLVESAPIRVIGRAA